jgi:hypothetical protein
MGRFLLLTAIFAFSVFSAPPKTRFEGVWKSGPDGRVYAVLTILSDNPLRGTMTRGEGAVDLFIQDTKVVRGKLRFKTIDPSDGVVQYELDPTSPSEATLSIGGKESVTLRRK